jgi:predicted dehydrogenase
MKKVKVGIIGTGNISSIYLESPKKFDILDIVAVADIDLEKAAERAKEFNIPKACSVAELLSDPEIEIVINLTIPGVHAEVSLQVLEAGKHVYVEKPLAIQLEDGKKVLETAKEKGLLVGGAPDTFLGGGLQTSRKLIDDGWIGQPVAATAFMLGNGPEGWHPNPEFFYKEGGGPLFDMGPYYITTLVNIMGPVKRITGSAHVSFEERMIKSQPKYGEKIVVETPTHITGLLDFEGGGTATLITSFDVQGSQLPRIEVYGTTGTLSLPDPNTFGGPIFVKKAGEQEWKEVPLTHGFTENSRGFGVADMAYALRNGRAHRCNGELTYHVLEIMHAILGASKDGKHYQLESTCERPAALPVGLSKDTFEKFE